MSSYEQRKEHGVDTNKELNTMSKRDINGIIDQCTVRINQRGNQDLWFCTKGCVTHAHNYE